MYSPETFIDIFLIKMCFLMMDLGKVGVSTGYIVRQCSYPVGPYPLQQLILILKLLRNIPILSCRFFSSYSNMMFDGEENKLVKYRDNELLMHW